MAFSDNKITSADLTGKGVTGMADTPNLTTAQMQQKLDEIAKEVIPPKFNSLCDALDLLGLSSLLTSASTSKMLYLRLNEYDQLEYSVNNVDYSLVASGKEVLDPTLEADNAKKLGGQLPAYYQKTTDNTLDTTSKTTTGAINEINTALGNVDTTANEAPPYSPSSTYALGKYVSHEKHVYECSTAIEVAEEWNATHWTQVTLGEEIETVNNSLVVNGTTFYFDIQNGVKGMNTDQNRGADTFTPFNSALFYGSKNQQNTSLCNIYNNGATTPSSDFQLNLVSGSSAGCFGYIAEPIDLTNINTIKCFIFPYAATSGGTTYSYCDWGIGVMKNAPTSYSNCTANSNRIHTKETSAATSVAKFVELDVSELSGNYYFVSDMIRTVNGWTNTFLVITIEFIN